MRRRRFEEEPCTISADVIAEYLAERGQYGMATFVRNYGQEAQRNFLAEKELRDQLHAALSRLRQYEPPAPEPERVTYRSEWD